MSDNEFCKIAVSVIKRLSTLSKPRANRFVVFVDMRTVFNVNYMIMKDTGLLKYKSPRQDIIIEFNCGPDEPDRDEYGLTWDEYCVDIHDVPEQEWIRLKLEYC